MTIFVIQISFTKINYVLLCFNSMKATLNIKLKDVNDNDPIITGVFSQLTLKISEATDINTEVKKLEATDADKDQKVSFSLLGSDHFNISSSGGYLLSFIFLYRCFLQS